MAVFLETARLVLRTATADDVDHLVGLNGDPEVMRYLTGGAATPREEISDAIIPAWLRYYDRYDGFGYWIAQTRDTGEFLGWFHFRPEPGDETVVELGYRLLRSCWGRGYATEGSVALISKGFTELGVRRVLARTMTVNAASRRVMEKCGLAYVRTFRSEHTAGIEGAEQGEVEYAVTREEWLAARARRG
jgi:RimJ/RimL family protein N-acetyltransferase